MRIVDNPCMNRSLQWDIFCKVIDNFGDIGVCWRLASDLGTRGQKVRLWIDDSSALGWMAPGGSKGVQVLPWHAARSLDLSAVERDPPDVLVEAFGCEVAPEFIATCAGIDWAAGQKGLKPCWINLEYLSAENYVERCHAMPSPVHGGPAAGWTKWFFYPGFTRLTGGLLREPDLAARQAGFDRRAWLAGQGIALDNKRPEKLVSLFCYEPPALEDFLNQLANHGLQGQPVRLLVTAGRAAHAVKVLFGDQNALQPNQYLREMLSISYLDLLTQQDFDHLLWACDLNLVRGEDSLVRALWAGQPLIWQIYPQADNVHLGKLEAFLDVINAPPSLRRFHTAWNSPGHELPAPDLPTWSACLHAARQALLDRSDLTTQLMDFAVQKRRHAP